MDAGSLEVSVSFGRFENDALSWEKWSSFSPNKYLEEVGNLSAPGSVAQKKAYFEAHYKKVAVKKIEQLEHEKSMEPVTGSSDELVIEGHLENSTEIDNKSGTCNGEKSVEENENETCMIALTNIHIVDEAKDDDTGSTEGVEQEACHNGLMDLTSLEEEKEDVVTPVECGNSTVEAIKEEVNGNVADPEINAREGEVSVAVETPPKDSSKIVKKPPKSKNGVEQSAMLKKEVSKLNASNKTQEVTPTKREKILAGKKKVVSPAVKSSQASTPRHLRPTSISTPVSVPRSLKNKLNGSPLPKSKNYAVEENKRTAPTSLHVSLSLGTENYSAALTMTMTRKSLIMERMGDKDIVKRAFKTFQNPANGKSSTLKQGQNPGGFLKSDEQPIRRQISTFSIPRKEYEGLRKDVGKTTTQRSQSGTRLKPFPSGSHESPASHPKNGIPVSPSISLKSDERAEKWQEKFLKKLEAKSTVRAAENAQVSEKSKEEKNSEIKKLRESLNFKATPMSSIYRSHRKGHSDRKEGV